MVVCQEAQDYQLLLYLFTYVPFQSPQRLVFPILLASLLRTQLAMELSVMSLTSQMSSVCSTTVHSNIIIVLFAKNVHATFNSWPLLLPAAPLVCVEQRSCNCSYITYQSFQLQATTNIYNIDIQYAPAYTRQWNTNHQERSHAEWFLLIVL